MSAPEVKLPDEQQIVAWLANQSQVPVAEVAKLYQHEYAKLSIGAARSRTVAVVAVSSSSRLAQSLRSAMTVAIVARRQ